MHLVYLLLGGNLGNRKGNIDKAKRLIEERVGALQQRSSLYETEAWGGIEQEPFLNQAVSVNTIFEPLDLLNELKNIENETGRIETVRWGPREIDIDILLMDDIIYESDELVIPHQSMQDRRFVLAPLVEIAADVVHPVLHKTISRLLKECKDQMQVKEIK